MERINNLLKKCKTVRDIKTVMNEYLSGKKDKYSLQLKINLSKENKSDRKQTSQDADPLGCSIVHKLLQKVYNYLLNQEIPTKSNDTKEVRTKGTAIGGMECHSRY